MKDIQIWEKKEIEKIAGSEHQLQGSSPSIQILLEFIIAILPSAVIVIDDYLKNHTVEDFIKLAKQKGFKIKEV